VGECVQSSQHSRHAFHFCILTVLCIRLAVEPRSSIAHRGRNTWSPDPTVVVGCRRRNSRATAIEAQSSRHSPVEITSASTHSRTATRLWGIIHRAQRSAIAASEAQSSRHSPVEVILSHRSTVEPPLACGSYTVAPKHGRAATRP
jgi:hypothetical protein